MLRLLGRVVVVALCAAVFWPIGHVAAQETPSAKATRKKLQTKISVDFKDTRMQDAVEDIKREFDNRLGVKLDNASGVSNNSKITYKANDETLEKILNDLATKYDFGYIVLSKPGDRNDGFILIRKSKERGYEEGKEPKKGKEQTLVEPPSGRPSARAEIRAATPARPADCIWWAGRANG